MRILYSFLLYLLLPFLFLRLLWKSRHLPAYRERLPERLGFYPFKLDACIWVHAVSMGEVIAAVPLIKEIKQLYPSTPLLVTTMTPTGANEVKKRLGDIVVHAYIPYDFPDAAARFITTMNPTIAIMMETELWPNLIAICAKKSIPVCLLNARLSEKSAKGYHRMGSFMRETLKNITIIATHASADAERFIALGAKRENVTVAGNIKFDLMLPPDLTERADSLRSQLGKDRFIWIAASTHQGEEEVILAAHQKIRQVNPNALLILVPRHPERFDAVAALCEKTFVTARRSKFAADQATEVYLGDTMGEMLLLYRVADVAFVGGSLIPRGGHNLLEPAALSKPVLSGPHLFNFVDISDMLKAGNALTLADNQDSLAAAVIELMQQPSKRTQLGEAAKKVMDANRGALARQLAVVHDILR